MGSWCLFGSLQYSRERKKGFDDGESGYSSRVVEIVWGGIVRDKKTEMANSTWSLSICAVVCQYCTVLYCIKRIFGPQFNEVQYSTYYRLLSQFCNVLQ